MSPSFPNHGTVHHEVIESQGSGDSGAVFSIGEMPLSHFKNQICGQFCVSVIFPSWNTGRIESSGMIVSTWPAFWLGSGTVTIPTRMNGPALSFHITNVFGLRSYKNVSRANAGCIVALMQGVEALRNFAIFNGPCDSVRWPIGSIYFESPVSSPSLTPCPHPTLSEFWKVLRNGSVFINSFPKSGLVFVRQFTDWLCSIRHNVSVLIVRAAMLLQQRAARLFTTPLLSFN